ncbi:MAG: YerC/YecD family TrpR-related protein [Candidatus Moranbacteria bacterium]|nr:YerC/YecD family TrpR-related protein [Candidatus Moranbacteria bacterium]
MNKNEARLYDAFLSLKDRKEVACFARDLMTAAEIKEFTNRLKAAGMLKVGESYSKIEKETGLSSRTVARVAQWLNDGKGGYDLVLDRLGTLQTWGSVLRGKVQEVNNKKNRNEKG